MTVTTKKKEYPPVEFMPYDPENGRMSKEDFIAKQEKIKAKKEKMDEYKKKIEAEAEAEAEAKVNNIGAPTPVPVIAEPPSAKPKGRPKKI